MMAPWRPLAVAAALNLSVAAGAAVAQTVTVTKAPPGSTVELAFNSAVIGTATADPSGRATLPLDLAAHGTRTETDAYIFVEYCDQLRRVIVVEPGMQALPGSGCPRKEIAGVYLLRKVTSFLIDVNEAAPSALIRQGPVPAEWLSADAEDRRAGPPPNAPGRGFSLFAGGGISSYANAAAVACGSMECSGGTKPITFSGGATYWISPYVAVEASYLKPGDVTLSGGETLYSWTTTFQTDIITVVGKMGYPFPYLRPYGFGGATFSRANWSTWQTIKDQTIIVDDVETTYKGGSQYFSLLAEGWSWIAGGGVEVPVSKTLSLYGEVGRAGITGDNRNNGEGKIDDRVLYAVGGIRLNLWRR